jgi:hypothetical protein
MAESILCGLCSFAALREIARFRHFICIITEKRIMKKFLLILAIGFSAISFQGCNDDKGKTSTDTDKDDIPASQVPQPVQSAFAAKYNAATNVQWEQAQENGAKTFKAKFTVDGKKIKAEYDSTGRFIKED